MLSLTTSGFAPWATGRKNEASLTKAEEKLGRIEIVLEKFSCSDDVLENKVAKKSVAKSCCFCW